MPRLVRNRARTWRRHAIRRAAACAAAALLLPVRAAATQQGDRPDTAGASRPSGSAGAAPAAVSAASPRVSLERYLELVRAGRFAAAAEYLDLPDSLRPDGPALARQLKAVLDRHVWFELETVSGAAAGDTADGLPPLVDQVATIRGREGLAQPVRLARADVGGEARWRFTRATVGRVPGWYAELGDRWLIEHLPATLLRPGPLEILWWQWVALPALLAIAVLLGITFSRVVRPLLARDLEDEYRLG